MKKAFQKDEALISDVRRVLAAGGRHVWWLGQSGFLIVQNGRALVLDPYLSDSLTRKYEETDKPHVRVTERVVEPAALAALGVIDVITSSHNHTDHFDPETLLPLLALNPQTRLVLPAANREEAIRRLGASAANRFLEMDEGRLVEVGGMQITGVASAHNKVERDKSGRCCFLGYIIKWGDLTVYHSGDTMWHEGLLPSLKGFEIDLALLPINGDRPERRVAGNLNGKEAAQLAHIIGAACVIPCHFDMFEFNTAAPDEFVAECRRLNQRRRVLGNGEGWDLSES
jgi:L-ascorbate metabolism protein UlaG (beta-lactamase superfamily)